MTTTPNPIFSVRTTNYRGNDGFLVVGSRGDGTRIFVHYRDTAEAIRDGLKADHRSFDTGPLIMADGAKFKAWRIEQ